MRPIYRSAVTLLALTLLAGCASGRVQRSQAAVTTAVEQPMRDLSLIQDEVAPVLTEAAVKPYAAAAEPADCAALRASLAELEKALGPDVDQPAPRSDAMAGLAGDLVRGAVNLPFRGIVRRVTGAEHRDAAYRRAVLAGMVRRGYLKGQLAARACPPAAV